MKKFIRHSKNIILVSNDNWKTIDPLKRMTSDAIQEEDNDKIFEAKIRYELGEYKGNIIIEELNKIRKMFDIEPGAGYGEEFEIFAISVINNIDYIYSKENYIVSGNYDGMVDAIDWSDKDQFVVYQIKIGNFDADNIAKIRENINTFKLNGDLPGKEFSHLNKFLKTHKNEITSEKSFKICVISLNEIHVSHVEHINSYDIFNVFFQNKMLPTKNGINLVLNLPTIGREKHPNISILSDGDQPLYVYFDKAKNLIESFMKCKQINNNQKNIYKLFSDNVRKFMGYSKKIQDTIKNDPANFVRYNNGITITGEVMFDFNSNELKIQNPVINNGQQTFLNLLKDPTLDDNLNILIIIKSNVDERIKSNIAQYTNDQKKVKSIDLLSLNYYIREIQKEIYNGGNYFIDIYSSGKREKIINKAYPPFHVITIKEFLRFYYSVNDIETSGRWKNTFSRMLDKQDLSLIKIGNHLEDYCKIISSYNRNLYLEKNKTKSAEIRICDLAIMEVMKLYDKSFEEAYDIIHDINMTKYYEYYKAGSLLKIYKKDETYVNVIESIKGVVVPC